jgi:hypothetical protein
MFSRSMIDDSRIVFDDPSVVLQVVASFVIIIYDHILIVQATGEHLIFFSS